jgi:hypothetical protein
MTHKLAVRVKMSFYSRVEYTVYEKQQELAEIFIFWDI